MGTDMRCPASSTTLLACLRDRPVCELFPTAVYVPFGIVLNARGDLIACTRASHLSALFPRCPAVIAG